MVVVLLKLTSRSALHNLNCEWKHTFSTSKKESRYYGEVNRRLINGMTTMGQRRASISETIVWNCEYATRS